MHLGVWLTVEDRLAYTRRGDAAQELLNSPSPWLHDELEIHRGTLWPDQRAVHPGLVFGLQDLPKAGELYPAVRTRRERDPTDRACHRA